MSQVTVEIEVGIEVSVEADGWEALGDAQGLSRRAVEAALRGDPQAPAGAVEVSLLLADDARMQALNRDWRGLDRPTNVLSFPAPAPPDGAGPRLLGDIALAFETLRREAEGEGKTLPHHFTHLVVHGTLHLIGRDHRTTEEAETMEALETAILATLGIADPYGGPEPAEE